MEQCIPLPLGDTPGAVAREREQQQTGGRAAGRGARARREAMHHHPRGGWCAQAIVWCALRIIALHPHRAR